VNAICVELSDDGKLWRFRPVFEHFVSLTEAVNTLQRFARLAIGLALRIGKHCASFSQKSRFLDGFGKEDQTWEIVKEISAPPILIFCKTSLGYVLRQYKLISEI